MNSAYFITSSAKLLTKTPFNTEEHFIFVSSTSWVNISFSILEPKFKLLFTWDLILQKNKRKEKNKNESLSTIVEAYLG